MKTRFCSIESELLRHCDTAAAEPVEQRVWTVPCSGHLSGVHFLNHCPWCPTVKKTNKLKFQLFCDLINSRREHLAALKNPQTDSGSFLWSSTLKTSSYRETRPDRNKQSCRKQNNMQRRLKCLRERGHMTQVSLMSMINTETGRRERRPQDHGIIWQQCWYKHHQPTVSPYHIKLYYSCTTTATEFMFSWHQSLLQMYFQKMLRWVLENISNLNSSESEMIFVHP